MILVLITLISHCTETGHALRVQQPYRVVATDGEARLRCSYHTRGSPEEMRLALYRGKYGEDQVCLFTFNTTQPRFQTDGPVQCEGELSPGRVDLTISGLKGEDSDLYRCRIEVLYPPPYLRKYGNGTIIYVSEKTDCPAPEAQTEQESQHTRFIMPIAALVSFILLIIIIIISTYKFFIMSQRRRMYPHVLPVMPKRVDCRFGYENFL